VQGRFKVFMIDEVHMLTNTAFNAMLKTLEEPPEYLKFVLATTDPQKVPVTVLSRCLQFNLRPMAPETVFEHLTQVLSAEQLTAEPQALRLLARAARGSMRDALSLTDQAIAFGNGQLQEAGVRQMLGSVDRSHVLQMVRALTDGDGAAVVAQVNDLRLQGVSAATTLEDMAMILQRMAVMQLVPSMAQDGDDPDTQGLAALAQAMPAEETQLLYSLCLHGRSELGLAPDEYAALTMVLLRLLAFKPQSASAEKKSPHTSPEPLKRPPTPAAAPTATPVSPPPAPVARSSSATGIAASPAPAPAPAPVSASASAPTKSPAPPHRPVSQPEPPPWQVLPDDVAWADPEMALMDAMPLDEPPPPVATPALRALPVRESSEPSARVDVLRAQSGAPLQETAEGEAWLGMVKALMDQEAITALVRELALQSQLVARDGLQWQLRVERETLNHPASRERLQAALMASGHGEVKLHIEIGPVTDSPAKRLAVQAAAKMQAAQELIQNDPLVQAMVRDFAAKIVPGSIQLM
jgi:DNA polymerase-3 subunit gamma/tau